MKAHKILLLGILLFPLGTKAQGEFSPLFLTRSVQSNLLNPAINDGSRFSLALPAPAILLVNQGFSAGDVLMPVPGFPDSFSIQVDQLVGALDDESRLFAETRGDIFHLAVGGDRLKILAGASLRNQLSLSYPVDALRLAWNGNAAYLDEPMQLGPEIRTEGWWEGYLGAQVGLGDKLRIGGKLKYLGGLWYGESTRSQIDFTTLADGYDLLLDVDYALRVAGPDLSVVDWSDASTLGLVQLPAIGQALAGNMGIGADLGIVFQPTEKLDLGFSALDIGFINWKTGFELGVQGEFEFEGIDVSPFFKGDSVNLEGYPDSLLSTFSVDQTTLSFQTSLPTRFVLHAGYEPVKWLRVQSMLQTRELTDRLSLAWALGAQLRAGRWLDFGLSYAYRPDAGNLIGLQSSVKLGPVMLYVMSDHVLAPVMWQSARLAHVRAGINLQIGRSKRPDRSTLEAPALSPD